MVSPATQQNQSLTSSSDKPSRSSNSDQEVNTLGLIPSNEEIGNMISGLDEISESYTRTHTIQDEESQRGESSSSGENEKTGPGAQKVGFFHSSLASQRWNIAVSYLKIWFILASLIIAAFSVYWGSLYDRDGHTKNLRMLVVNEDYSTIDDLSPSISEFIEETLNTTLKSKGDYHFFNTETFVERYNHKDDIRDKIIELVHHRKFWAAIHIKPNATYQLFQSYQNLTTPGTAVEFVYESGRDITNVPAYVVKTLDSVQSYFVGNYSLISSPLISKLNNTQKLNLIESDVITSLPTFFYNDYRPYTDNTLLAPLQVGLIYIIIISFFLFNFFAQVHLLLVPHIKPSHYVLYRIISSQISYIVLALFVCTVSAIFQIDFTKAFGKGGFVIYWFTSYLVMSAVGGANENMAMIIFIYKPPLLGLWLISWVILNISPSFSPMALLNRFYRYGYAFPIHNGAEIFRVIFLDLWKGELGRNYGILCIWLVVNNVVLCFALKHVGQVMGKRAQKAAQGASK